MFRNKLHFNKILQFNCIEQGLPPGRLNSVYSVVSLLAHTSYGVLLAIASAALGWLGLDHLCMGSGKWQVYVYEVLTSSCIRVVILWGKILNITSCPYYSK